MNRREVLRLLSMVGTLVGTGPVGNALDLERLEHAATGPGRLDTATLTEYAELNTHLWRVFVLSKSKAITFPLVRQQLSVLAHSLQRSNSSATHLRLCGLVGDLFQLAGEISFDNNQYTDAAQCYALAASASKEAAAYDLWACAMTRHAFIGVYERQFRQALPMLDLAVGLAHKGDRTLSTWHWVNTVRAQALAGLRDLDGCQRALHMAEEVHELDGQIHNGGWLRFDGSRLAEERGTCYVELQRTDLAETALTDALSQTLSPRRHGSVLADLAVICAQRQDVSQLINYATTALEMATQTGSGVLSHKLQNVQSSLPALLGDRRVQHLDQEITALVRTSATR